MKPHSLRLNPERDVALGFIHNERDGGWINEHRENDEVS